MATTRRNFVSGAASLGGLAVAGCATTPPPAPEPAVPTPACKAPVTRCRCCRPGRVALQLYSIRDYIKANGLAKALGDIAAVGYEGVEFAGYYGFSPEQLKAMLRDNGLLPCGTHRHNKDFGFDTSKWKYNRDTLAETCDFELAYGNTTIICPGGGNRPGNIPSPSKALDNFAKRLCDFYNKAAWDAARLGCRIGLHNHQWEFQLKMTDGTSFWDYFFSHTCDLVLMEQDVGWTVCAGEDPAVQYLKYPHRSRTLHAKENGMGKGVKTFDAILGQPGQPGAKGVDWDRLFPVTDADGVQWYVVECERHHNSLDAVIPSWKFLESKERV